MQNIRNNKNKNRTPKWGPSAPLEAWTECVAIKHGLVEDYAAKRKVKREWANRYDERLPNNDYDNAPAEDEWGNPVARSEAESRPAPDERPQRSTLDPHDEAHYSSNGRGARHDSYEARSHGDGNDFSELPGAGDRVVRHQTGGAFNKIGAMAGGKKKSGGARSGGDDRFARMDAERDRAGYRSSSAPNADFDESWMAGGARGAASSGRSSGALADPLGAAPARQWKPTDDLPDHNF